MFHWGERGNKKIFEKLCPNLPKKKIESLRSDLPQITQLINTKAKEEAGSSDCKSTSATAHFLLLGLDKQSNYTFTKQRLKMI